MALQPLHFRIDIVHNEAEVGAPDVARAGSNRAARRRKILDQLQPDPVAAQMNQPQMRPFELNHLLGDRPLDRPVAERLKSQPVAIKGNGSVHIPDTKGDVMNTRNHEAPLARSGESNIAVRRPRLAALPTIPNRIRVWKQAVSAVRCVACIAALALAASSVSAADWPTFKHDRRLTGRTPAKGAVTAEPEILGEYALTGVVTTLMADLNATSTSFQDVALPDEPALAGAQWTEPAPLIDLRGDGVLVPPPGGPETLTGAVDQLVAQVLKDQPGYQSIKWHDYYSEEPTGYMEMLSYEAGAEEPRRVWRSTPLEPGVYETLMLAVDANNDGQKDIALATHYHVAIWDGATGKKIMEVRPPVARNYGSFGYFFVEGNPYPQFFTIVDFQSHFDVYGNDGKELTVLWREDVENPNILRVRKIVRVGPDPVADINGDGRLELVFNYYDRTGDREWHVMGYDALTGEIVLDLPETFLDGIADITGDGFPEMFCKSTKGQKTKAPGELRIYSAAGGGDPAPIWRRPNSLWVTHDAPRRADLVSIGTDNRRTVMLANGPKPGLKSFFVTESAGERQTLRGFRLDEAREALPGLQLELDGVKSLQISAIADVDQDGIDELKLECVGRDPVATAKANGRVVRLAMQETTGLTDPPIVISRNEGPPLVAIPTMTREYVGLTFSEGQFHEQWRLPGWGMPGATFTQIGLTSADLDGDGAREILAAGKNERGEATVQASDLAGNPLWTQAFAEFDGDPPIWNVGGLTHIFAGRFSDPQRDDVLVSVRRSIMHSDEGHMLDGATGEERWSADRVGIEAPGQGDTGYGFLGNNIAAVDLNADERDEIVGVYPVDLYAFSGDGEQLMGRFLDGWGIYGQHFVHDFLGSGTPQILSAAPGSVALLSSEGEIIWKDGEGEKAGTTWPLALTDMDGDGAMEASGAGFEDGFRVYDGATGEVLHRMAVEKSTNRIVPAAGDLDGDGRDEVLWAVNQTLYAAGLKDGALGIEWKKEFPALVRFPVLADITGDGLVEILVSCHNGRLYVLGN